jgi:3-oxoacyl-[acyl-carrier protein] reductase
MSGFFDLAGQVALITGASRGIGRSILEALAAHGATVVGTATTAEGAAALDAHIQSNGWKGKGVVFNVNDASGTDALFEQVASSFGAVSVLVNNAGITRDQLAMRMKDEDWDAVISTNLSSVFRLTRASMRAMMKARGGRVINITSVVGTSGNPGQSNYAAAKAGVAGMTRALARELGSRNITVNCIAPGFIETDMTKSLSEAQSEALLGQIPLGRLGKPDDIAAAVVYLASPGAAYVTGTTLHVNGGMWMGG